jgi:hypothetical protein
MMSKMLDGRRKLHLRRIFCEGYERDDGLIDIEGTLIDTKPYPIDMPEKVLAADEAIHQMTVRMTIDHQRVIRDVDACTLDSPYRVCSGIVSSYRQLIGLRIEPGFTQKVKRMFRGTLGCTHLTELLPPMATTAFQILWAQSKEFGAADEMSAQPRSSPLGGCHALRLDGEVVRMYMPDRYQAPDAGPTPASGASSNPRHDFGT